MKSELLIKCTEFNQCKDVVDFFNGEGFDWPHPERWKSQFTGKKNAWGYVCLKIVNRSHEERGILWENYNLVEGEYLTYDDFKEMVSG